MNAVTEKLGTQQGNLPVALLLCRDMGVCQWLRDAVQDLVTLLPAESADSLPQILTHSGASLLLAHFDGSENVAAQLARLHEVFPQLHIVGFGAVQDQAILLSAVRSRVSDFVEAQGSADTLRAAVVKALDVDRRRQQARSQRLVAVTGAIGSGNTTAASNLITLLSQREPRKEMLLLDFGTPTGDAAIGMGVQSNLTFAEAVRNLSRCDHSYLRNGIASTDGGIGILPLFQEPRELRGLRIQEAFQLLSILQSIYDLVVADIGGSAQPELSQYLLQSADLILVLCDQSVNGILKVKEITSQLIERNVDPGNIRLLVGHYQEILGITPQQIADELEVKLLGDGLLQERRVPIIQAHNTGKTVVEYAPRDPLARQLTQLAEIVARQLSPEELPAPTGSRNTSPWWNWVHRRK